MNVGGPLLVAFFLMVLSLLVAIGLAYLDRKTEKLEKIKH